ncbi:hypothetical protein ACFQ08_10700 [Streptosporangium algeriense]|uniref:PH domain-containing protein n=1 Tax=Streptosporangium algeriense TaxID=1682748 RepID=A0ABW3DPK5_9ACTN
MSVTAEADRWLAALDGLYSVPDEHRVGFFDRAGAVDLLRCGEEVFDELVKAGLPFAEESDGERFDRFDLFNLALASRSGTSVPEKAIRYALRWMHGGPETWTARLDWTFHVTLECPLDACGDEPQWTHARMLPEAVGGELYSWRVEPEGARIVGDHLRHEGPGPLLFAGHVSTSGELMGLRSPTLRRIVDDFFAVGYRWVRLPEPLQWEYERLLAAGVSPCISASLFLKREFEKAGYPAFTRRGWLLGMLDLAHSWVEVTDDDGVVKPVDPIFTWLTGHADRPHPDLAAASIGSRMNRLLPAAMAADGLMATHLCGGRHVDPRRKTVIRRKSTQEGAAA